MVSRGVSNLVGVLLALVITIAAAAVAFTVVMHYVSVSAQNVQITIQSVSLIKSSDTAIFSITIKNEGTVALNALMVTINGNSISSFEYGGLLVSSSNPLPAGANTSYESSTLSGTFTIGLTYLVHVTVTGKTGSTYAIDENVLCVGA